MDPGLESGYAYHIASERWNNKIRNILSQFSDIFSEFNTYIAPAYHHDRCERSVQMRLYSMHKRQLVMVFVVFLACLGISIFFGLTGPPIMSTAIRKISLNGSQMATGPFVIKTPALSTYNQELWVLAKLSTLNNEDERYEKSFEVRVSVNGLTKDNNAKPVVTPGMDRNSSRKLNCDRQFCEEFVIAHIGYLDFCYYEINVRFYGLQSFYQHYIIKSITFYFKHYNPAFTQIEIWLRFIFLFITFGIMCWFVHSLRKYSIQDWSIEQKWLFILLPLLILYDNPLFPLTFLVNSWIPDVINASFQTTFQCAILLFWLCAYHSLRQNDRRFITFYLPKVFIVGLLWISILTSSTWAHYTELEDPAYNYVIAASNYSGFKVFFFTIGGLYVLYLLLLILKAYTELQSMPFFDLRLRFLTVFGGLVSGIYGLIMIQQFGTDVSEFRFVSRFTAYYRTSAQFMALYSLLNFYVYTMVYVYAPVAKRLNGLQTPITKDNPSFSMITDSDEEVVYESDDNSHRLLSRSLINIDDSD
ncbi:transmembrane protein 181 [Prorops nasuta]|uniref:transmembrane protein 181 n=1 Tax=Prorops nasuta TaxID=863751 RepID=UPI0034CD654A